MWFYYIGMVLLGISTGFLVANSMTPIAGILLPLLFSLIGGGAGAYILKLGAQQRTRSKAIDDIGSRDKLLFCCLLAFDVFFHLDQMCSFSPRISEAF